MSGTGTFHRGEFKEPRRASHSPVNLSIKKIQHVSNHPLGIAANHDGFYEYTYNKHDGKHGGLPLCFFGASIDDTQRGTIVDAIRSEAKAAEEGEEAKEGEEGEDEEMVEDEISLAHSVTAAGSRYGTVRFEVTLEHAVAAYGPYELRLLGTTTYQLEHEHAIVVARPGDRRVKDLPLLSKLGADAPLPLLSELGVDAPLRLDEAGELCWTSSNLKEGLGQDWVAVSVAFLQPSGDSHSAVLALHGAVVSVSLTARLIPNPRREPARSVADAEEIFVENLVRHICPKNSARRYLKLPSTMERLVEELVDPARPGFKLLEKLIVYTPGTTFEAARGVNEKHVTLNRFPSKESWTPSHRVALLFGYLIASIKFV